MFFSTLLKIATMMVITGVAYVAFTIYAFRIIAGCLLSLYCSSSTTIQFTVILLLFILALIVLFILYIHYFKLRKFVIVGAMILPIPLILLGNTVLDYQEQWQNYQQEVAYIKEARVLNTSLTLGKPYIAPTKPEDTFYYIVIPMQLSQPISGKSIQILLKPETFLLKDKAQCAKDYYELPNLGYSISDTTPNISMKVLYDPQDFSKEMSISPGQYYLRKSIPKTNCTLVELQQINFDQMTIQKPHLEELTWVDFMKLRIFSNYQ